MRELIKRLQPDTFEDLIALVALFRPGPLQSGMVDDFIDRKHGRARVSYPHPELEPVLRPTYGVILYQEQVMQIARVLAGYTLGAADLLRRAMGKKKPEEMAKQRAIFTRGAADRGVEPALATRIFDLMEKFAGYGFNKSHSAAYALVAYQTAWLKAHYPAAFMAAVLSADMDNTDKVVNLIDECRRLGLAVEPPDVNSCGHAFQAADERTVRYGLGAIKGVGASAIDAITHERDARGPFIDLFDLCRRVDLRRANRRVLEALIKAGALDRLGPGRRAMALALGDALQIADQHARNRQTGQEDLFGLECSTPGPAEPRVAVAAFADVAQWSDEERLAGEKETLGLYLTGHPIDRYEAELGALTGCRLAELRPGMRRVAGLLVGMRTTRTRRGRIAFATIDDRSARAEVRIFPALHERRGEALVRDPVGVDEGECALDDYTGEHALTAAELWSIDEARARFARRLVLQVDADRAGNGFVDRLATLIAPAQGECPIDIEYGRSDARARIRLGRHWGVRPSDALLEAMRASFGPEHVHLEY